MIGVFVLWNMLTSNETGDGQKASPYDLTQAENKEHLIVGDGLLSWAINTPLPTGS